MRSIELTRSIAVPINRLKPKKESWYTARRAITIATLGSLAIVGGYHIGVKNGVINSATNAVTAEMPNFHGQSAEKFLAKSPKIRDAIKNGSLVEIFVDNIPLQKSILPTPNSYFNIAEIITPKNGDMNVVANTLLNNQSPEEPIVDKTIVNPGQEFIVPATAGAIELANAEAQQGIYISNSGS
ncbi:MAG TPA: hypothetical protein VMV24_01335 [Candidatus Dormibacteraeota bacterium]|nr:hypothetical protein [Candidatus Dormibacteraeota bacterium]